MNFINNNWRVIATAFCVGAVLATGVIHCPAMAAPARSATTAKSARPRTTRSPAKVPAKTPAKPKPQVVRLRIEVPCRAWVPKVAQPHFVLLCVHGLGLNSASYENLGQRMSKTGIATFAVDVRGFGTWMKLEGKHQLDFDSCISDVVQALKVLHTAYPDKPVFILGESMGGAIALRVTAEHPELVDGLISCVPSGDRFHPTKEKLRVALKLMTFQMNKEMDVGSKVIDEATENLTVRTKWKEDPFNRLKLTPKELMQFQRFMNDNEETAKKIDRTPVLFVAGMNDKLVKPQGTIDLFEQVATDDKKLMTIQSAEHLVFEQSQCTAQVFNAVVEWMRTHKPDSVTLARRAASASTGVDTTAEVVTRSEPPIPSVTTGSGSLSSSSSSSSSSARISPASYSYGSGGSASISNASYSSGKKEKRSKKSVLKSSGQRGSSMSVETTKRKSIFDEVHSH